MKLVIHSWKSVAKWSWQIDSELCSICRHSFDACCPDCKFPGDDCPPVFGACDHPFHMHCLEKWLKSQREGQEVCPLCRAEWQYKQS